MANQPSKYSKFLVGAASAALVASAVAPVASAADFSDVKGNTHEDAINSLVKAGVISGYPDGSFLPNKTLTRSDVVKMMGKLLVSLGNEVPTDYKTNPRFTDQTSKTNDELLQASALVKDHGVFNGLENGSLDAAGDITRENMAIVLVRAYDAINKTDLVAYVKEQEFKKDVTDLATAKAEARPYIDVLDFFDITNPVNPTFNPKDTTTRGQFASFLFKTTAVESPAEKVTTATKVESVTATNLKEVVVAFDGTVDEDTATDKANYTLKSGKAIDSVAISADKKTVTLTLVSYLANNKADALNVSGVDAGDKTIDVKNFEFTAADNAVPTVTEVKSLGTKSLKVVFSEPVNDVQQANFTLDGKSYFGKVTTVGNEVILTPYDSAALAVGEHTVVVEKVKDYADFTSLRTSHDFTVVEDKDAPTIVEAKATLEKVTITFSEDIDMDTVDASKVYWKSGSSNREADSYKRLSATQFEFTFLEDDTLPTGNVDVFVEGVKDYSGNAIAKDSKVTVSPVVDQTRPEVKKVTALTATTFEVKFSKNVNVTSAESASNYTVLDKDGKVIPVQKADVTGTGDTVQVTLYSALSTGTNKVTVKNVKDNTKLQNTMLDFTGSIVVGDTAAPSIDSKTANETQRRLVIGFSEKMDVATLADYSNYLVDIDGKLQVLTSSLADISVQQDGKVVVITFVEKIGGKAVQFANAGDTTQVQVNTIQVLGVKDLAGNLLSNFTTNTGNTINLDTVANSNPLLVEKATLVNTKTVELKLNAGIVSASNLAITGLAGTQSVSSIEVNGTSTIIVKFKEDFAVDKSDVDFGIDGSKLVTLAGAGTGTPSVAHASVVDKVAPSIIKTAPVTAAGNQITITFDEDLKAATLPLLGEHLEVSVNGVLLDSAALDYSVAAGTAREVVVTVAKNGIVAATDVTVALKNGTYVQDTAGNVANTFTAKKVASGTVTEAVLPTFAASITGTKEVTVVFSEKVNKVDAETITNYTFDHDGSSVEAVVSATLQADGKTVKIVTTTAPTAGAATIDASVEDLAGNTSATNVVTLN